MKTILVTGATGYIGLHLMEQLRMQLDTRVLGMTRGHDVEAQGWEPIAGDILEPELYQRLRDIRPDVIYHLAAAQRDEPLGTQLQVNVVGTHKLLHAVSEAGITPRIIITGSAAEYGPCDTAVSEDHVLCPASEYGIAKAAQTQIALCDATRYQLPVAVARIFNVYGHTDESLSVAAMASKIAALDESDGKPYRMTVYNLESSRDFIHVEDIAAALVALAEKGQPGEVYNIASGVTTRTKALLENLLDAAGIPHDKIELDRRGAQTPDVSLANTQKLIDHTDWRPQITLQAGLARELEFWRNRHQFLRGTIVQPGR
jgi:GDP-4-dehydro-6-deoxy-D-mannose reductase